MKFSSHAQGFFMPFCLVVALSASAFAMELGDPKKAKKKQEQEQILVQQRARASTAGSEGDLSQAQKRGGDVLPAEAKNSPTVSQLTAALAAPAGASAPSAAASAAASASASASDALRRQMSTAPQLRKRFSKFLPQEIFIEMLKSDAERWKGSTSSAKILVEEAIKIAEKLVEKYPSWETGDASRQHEESQLDLPLDPMTSFPKDKEYYGALKKMIDYALLFEQKDKRAAQAAFCYARANELVCFFKLRETPEIKDGDLNENVIQISDLMTELSSLVRSPDKVSQGCRTNVGKMAEDQYLTLLDAICKKITAKKFEEAKSNMTSLKRSLQSNQEEEGDNSANFCATFKTFLEASEKASSHNQGGLMRGEEACQPSDDEHATIISRGSSTRSLASQDEIERALEFSEFKENGNQPDSATHSDPVKTLFPSSSFENRKPLSLRDRLVTQSFASQRSQRSHRSGSGGSSFVEGSSQENPSGSDAVIKTLDTSELLSLASAIAAADSKAPNGGIPVSRNRGQVFHNPPTFTRCQMLTMSSVAIATALLVYECMSLNR